MARGWHGNSEGHARAGRLGGRKSAEVRQRNRAVRFGEQLQMNSTQAKKRGQTKTIAKKA